MVTSSRQTSVSASSGLHQFLRLLPVVGLVWLFFFPRAHAVENMAYFIDELRHIGRAQIVWSFKDIDISTTPHKFLVYYWIGIFGPSEHLPGWLSRTAVALYTPIGAAGTFALAKTLFSRRTALAALLLLGFFPFMFFYDRLALSDPLASPLAVLVAWWSIKMIQKPSDKRAIGLGILASLMLIGKVITGTILLMPVTAALFLSPYRLEWGQEWRPQLKKLWLVYGRAALITAGTVVVIWGVILGFYVIRTIVSPTPSSPIVNPYLYQSAGPIHNVERVLAIFRYLWGPLLIGLMAVSIGILGRRYPYRLGYLLSGIVPLWIIMILVAKELTTRYLTVTGQLWVVLMVGGWGVLGDELAQRLNKHGSGWGQALRWLPLGVILVWVLSFALPFWSTLVDDPLQLEIPTRDQHEYFRNQTGYGIRDLMLDVSKMENISQNSDVPVLVGEVRNCSLMLFHIPDNTPLKLECSVYSTRHSDEWPELEKRMSHFNTALETYGAVYMMVERFAEWPKLIDEEALQGEMTLLGVYERPFEGIAIELYRVEKKP